MQEFRQGTFKNRGAMDELRRRRDDAAVEIRKQNRQETISKRRNLLTTGTTDLDDSDSDQDQENSGVNKGLQEQFPVLISGVYSNNLDDQVSATGKFRKILSKERNPPIDDVIACGVVPRFVEFLGYSQSPVLQFEAAWLILIIIGL